MSVDILREGDGWVIFQYPDESKVFFRTTLNEQVLSKIPGGSRPDMLYDLDRFCWRSFPANPEVRLDIQKDRPVVEEVDEFVNSFISG